MWWILAFIGLFVVIVILVMKMDTLSRQHNRLLVQFKLMDNETAQVQQFTYELAEEFCLNLQHQLQHAKRLTRFNEAEFLKFEMCIQAIPSLCKEMATRPQSLKQAMTKHLRKNGLADYGQLDSFINQYGKLIAGWQRDSFVGYLQMCQQIIALVEENAHKDHTRTLVRVD